MNERRILPGPEAGGEPFAATFLRWADDLRLAGGQRKDLAIGLVLAGVLMAAKPGGERNRRLAASIAADFASLALSDEFPELLGHDLWGRKRAK